MFYVLSYRSISCGSSYRTCCVLLTQCEEIVVYCISCAVSAVGTGAGAFFWGRCRFPATQDYRLVLCRCLIGVMTFVSSESSLSWPPESTVAFTHYRNQKNVLSCLSGVVTRRSGMNLLWGSTATQLVKLWAKQWERERERERDPTNSSYQHIIASWYILPRESISDLFLFIQQYIWEFWF